jgi:hypothetical protein
MKSILIIINYFGKWPEWLPIFLASCEANPTVNWLINTDCPIPDKYPANVSFSSISLSDHYRNISSILGIHFNPINTYKLCDIKAFYGALYAKEIERYDYYGYGDIDVVYGNIRKFYNDQVLKHNVISAHDNIVSGHLALFKNIPKIKNAFHLLPKWKEKLENQNYMNLDEYESTIIFKRPKIFSEEIRARWPLISKCGDLFLDITRPRHSLYWRNNYFVEQYSTPFIHKKWHDSTMDHPDTWYWYNGKLTNNKDGDREFLYFHFMNFKYPRYIHSIFGTEAPWGKMSKLLKFDKSAIGSGRIRIDKQGFHLES